MNLTIDEKDRPYWKKVTIEVDKSHWKALFSTIAIPLLQHLKNENAITAYYLEIGKDVLHFAYKTSDGKKSDVVKMLRAFLLSENNAISTVKINSLKAGGFVYPLHNYGDLVSDFYPFEEFSDIIMAVFSTQKVSDEMIFMLSMHLQLGWIKMRARVCREPISSIIVKGYCWFVTPQMMEGFIPYLEKLFAGAKDDLINLYRKIMNYEVQSPDKLPPWMLYWFKVSSNAIIRNMTLNFNNEYLSEMTYYYIPNLINHQMGLDNEDVLTQMYYINQIVLHSNKTNSL